MITIEISASTVAWYAAIVATLSAIASIHSILRDRPKLRVEVRPNRKVYPKGTCYGDKTYIVVTVTNVGRRPITVTEVLYETPKKTDMKISLADSYRSGSRELGEGKQADYLCVQAELPAAVRYVCVLDSTGRMHRKHLSREVLRAIAESKDKAANGEQG